jgi:hypothetical protein
LAAEWNARPTEDALRAERDAALAERARLRALIAEAAADLPLHPEGAHLTQPEEDAEAVRVALLAALRGEALARPCGCGPCAFRGGGGCPAWLHPSFAMARW